MGRIGRKNTGSSTSAATRIHRRSELPNGWFRLATIHFLPSTRRGGPRTAPRPSSLRRKSILTLRDQRVDLLDGLRVRALDRGQLGARRVHFQIPLHLL